jgi:DNA-binding response OmpR family regulator
MNDPFALIVEDDVRLAEIFSFALQAAEFQTEISRDGAAAVTRLAETIPDVVLLDLHLPHYSGSEILRQIRADARLSQTRVILATADGRLAESLRDEADLVLLKPISPTQLRDLAKRLRPVNRVLDKD